MMPGVRHGLKRAVAPGWPVLVSIRRPLARDQRAGCRRWAVRDLGILRDVQAVGELVSALGNEQPMVRSEACVGLGMLGRAVSGARPQIRAHLQCTAAHDTSKRSAVAHNGPSKRSPDRKGPTVKRTPGVSLSALARERRGGLG
jgi:hypothetical protein